MKQALRISAFSLVAAVVVTATVAAFQIYALCSFDEKWGSRVDNLILVVQLAVLTGVAQAVLLFVLLLVPRARGASVSGLPELLTVAVFAVLTAWWFPPHNRHVVLAVIAIPVLAFLTALTGAHLRGPTGRRGQGAAVPSADR